MSNAALPGSQPAGVPRDLVFVSYSHSDRDWLTRLLVFLKAFTGPNFRVWADPHIKVGDEWRRDISGAMSRACVAVLLVSPDFLASDFIRNEELPPLLEGAKAGTITLFPIPISASNYRATALTHYQFAHPPERPLDRMPRPRRHAALVEITEKIVKASQIAPPDVCAPPIPVAERPATAIVSTGHAAALHGVPGQRPNYLRRQEYLDRLKEAVLGSAQQAIGITGAPQGGRVGLHGMGGIGKTVLAIDLVNDDDVRRAFPDGIFWLTLGQSIQPLQLQAELAAFIGGETKAFATVNEAGDQLRQLLDGKTCLLVLDDLWRREDGEPFDVLGPRSRLLLTTRDADLLTALSAGQLSLEVLSDDLGLELLASWSGHARSTMPEAALGVASACGFLPLALALAGARVQGGARWEEVLSALERGRLEFLDHPYGSVFNSSQLSTDALPEAERTRYFELAVFPEDAVIPAAAICTLWRHTRNMREDASRDLLLRLHRRALLARSEDGGHISFHDLQHDFLRLNISSLVAVHAALVDAYRTAAPSGWAEGPDDGYFFQHLPQHLTAAERLDELKALLSDYNWLTAKLRTTNIVSVLADYDLIVSDSELALIEQALRLSIPALLRDGSQLPSQLLGRLRGTGGPAIDTLLARAEQGPARAWLRPRFASLTPPGGPLRQILVGHTNWVSAVAVPADERCALSGSWDSTLRLWDLATGATLRILKGHTGSVTAVALFADGRRALSGSWDNTLRLWDLATGETLRTLVGHTNGVSAVAVLADGDRALSGSYDNTLRLCDLATGQTLRTFEGHTGEVTSVAVLADGSLALSGSYDKTLRLWDLATGETLRTLEGHANWVSAMAVLADSRRALSGSWDDTLRLWDLATGEALRTLEGHSATVDAVAVLADGSRALSGSGDNTLRLWDLATGETLRVLEGHAGMVAAVALFADGSRALSGSYDNTLRLWNLATGATLHTFEGHMNLVTAVVVLADGSRALSGSWDWTLRLWDLATGETLRTLEGHGDAVSAAAVRADGSRALSGSDDNTLRLWDLKTGECLAEYSADAAIHCVAFARDDLIVAGSADGRIHILEIREP
jgi:WD40 repeat protein